MEAFGCAPIDRSHMDAHEGFMKEHLAKIYALAGILAASVSFAAQNAKPGVVHLAKFSDSSIDESSGLAASKRYP